MGARGSKKILEREVAMKHAIISNVILLIIYCGGLMSCNSLVKIHIDYPPTEYNDTIANFEHQTIEAEVSVRISIAQFFIHYLEDLLGVEGIKGLVQEIELEEFLSVQSSIDNPVVSTSSLLPHVGIIEVKFKSNNIFETMSALQLPYSVISKDTYSYVTLQISREFIVSFINYFPELREVDLVTFLLPEEDTVPQSQFSKYIAWSFSEYQLESSVIKILNESDIIFIMKKPKNNNMFDKGWKQVATKNGKHTILQETRFMFVPVLYADNQELVFSF